MIITLTGPAGSGKDTVADYLVANHGFTKVSWAGPLKAGLAAMGFPEPKNRDDKEVQIPGFNFSWRQAAQTLGTEWGRGLDPDIWLKIMGRQLSDQPEGNWVVSDTRFENEAALIRALGGSVWHMAGRAADLGSAAGHVSESGLAFNSDRDVVLGNGGSMGNLFAQVDVHLFVSPGTVLGAAA